MKKMMFVAAAALMMCLGFIACSSSAQSPAEKAIAGLEEMLNFCKNYEVKSIDDLEAFKGRFDKFMKGIEEKYGDVKDISNDDLTPEQQQRVEELSEALQTEMGRIMNDALSFSSDLLKDMGGDVDLDELKDAVEQLENAL